MYSLIQGPIIPGMWNIVTSPIISASRALLDVHDKMCVATPAHIPPVITAIPQFDIRSSTSQAAWRYLVPLLQGTEVSGFIFYSNLFDITASKVKLVYNMDNTR